jgi:hypothetical protein
MSGSKNNSASSMMGTLGNSANAANTGAPVVSESNLKLIKEYMPQLQKLFAKVQ